MYNTLYSDRILQKQRLAKSMKKKNLSPIRRQMRKSPHSPQELGLLSKIPKPCLLFGDYIPARTIRSHDNSPTPSEGKKPICFSAMPPTAQRPITQHERKDVKIIHQEAAFPICSSQTPALSYKSSQKGICEEPPPPTFCVPPTPPPTPSPGPSCPSSFPPPPPRAPSTLPSSPPLRPVVRETPDTEHSEGMSTASSVSGGGCTNHSLELPECITTAVLQLCKTKATRDMDPKLAMQLSKQYPHGFFEAVEALTFVTQSSWWTPLMMEITNPYFHNLWDTTMCTYVRQKVKGGVVNPPSRAFLFAPFNCTPLHKVKVVIPALGPTCGRGFQSDGLAYSVLPKDGNRPHSGLFQLLKQLHPDFVKHPHTSLRRWAEQGVFLFNISLVSVDESKVCSPNCGMILTFKDFSAGVAKILDKNCGHLVFLVFKTSNDGYLRKHFMDFLSPDKHTIIEGPNLRHTCFNSNEANCFRRVNTELEKLGKTPIDWTAL